MTLKARKGDVMDIEYFREFLEISKSDSISQTAKDLYRSQSALSRHLQALETDFGAQLLVRTGNSVELTPEGEVVRDLAATIVHKYDYVKEAFTHPEPQHKALVISGHIDAPEDVTGFLRAVERFNAESPGLPVRFEPFDSMSMHAYREKLISDEADRNARERQPFCVPRCGKPTLESHCGRHESLGAEGRSHPGRPAKPDGDALRGRAVLFILESSALLLQRP